MKKLFIYGSQGAGKTTAVLKIIRGKKAIVCTPIEPITTIMQKIQNEQYDYIVFDNANGFDKIFLEKILDHDSILNQSDNSTLIIVVQSKVSNYPLIMEKNNLLTAVEARKKSAEATNIESIMKTIEEAINIGAIKVSFWHIPISDITKLEKLGYCVTITESDKCSYIVSW